MKIFLTASTLEVKATRQRQKLNAVNYLLDKDENVLRRRFLRKLAEYLLFPDSYLISLPAKVLSSLIVQIFEFLEGKEEGISIQQNSLIDNSQLLLVTSPDVPYIIDSILSLRQKHHLSFQLLAHPVLAIKRLQKNVTYLGSDAQSGEKELLIVIRLEYVNPFNLALLENEIKKVIAAALDAYRNRSAISRKLEALKDIDELNQWSAFIDWLNQDAFIPFVYQRLSAEQYEKFSKNRNLNLGYEFCIGMEIDEYYEVDYEEELLKILERNSAVLVQTIPCVSPIIRNDHLTYIGFREPSRHNSWVEHAFLGLFNEIELNGNACNVPELCKKIGNTLDFEKVSRDSHEFFQLQELFNLFPKVELFFLGETQMHLLVQSLILYLYRPDTLKLLFLASSSPDRISTLIIIPQQLYKEEIETVLQARLCQELSCSLENSRTINSGGCYIGLQLTLKPQKDKNWIDVNSLERKLNRLAWPWEFRFRLLLERVFGKEKGGRLWLKYHLSFLLDYQASMPPRYAVRDLLQIEKVLSTKTQCINLVNPSNGLQDYRLQFYSEQEHFLDEYIPVLENLNLRLIDQVQYAVTVDGSTIFIKSFSIQPTEIRTKSLRKLRPQILDTVQAILDGKAENDALNSLVVQEGMAWKEIDVLRAYRNYYLQLGYQSTLASFHHGLLNNSHVARCLYDYFEARFRPVPEWDDPALREENALFPLRMKLLENIETVSEINDDRILRTLFNLIDSTVRSNFHVRRNVENYFFAFKINSLGIIDMPAPRPQNEIYVHAIDMEGIHLRGGKISRGGIRWSDRPDDFRTEILGLMQTQMSKNALIIPKGAKGGFVVTKSGAGEGQAESGKRAYITLMQGLLDLTDNYQGEQVVKLPGIVAYDDKDPYLVVAADKGTAQFPDIANSVAAEYSFWLRDAFASGGSQGYNHKQLGITARGAWESVKRHFRELGKDIQTEPFTVVGIGSMDGDVFGNGMLLSPCTQLLAAFSGQHIFIDPHPDPERSFVERRRLFDLPGSSWNDYDRTLISDGGGVYRRDDKDIPISAEVGKWLGIRYRSLDGESLIRYLLMGPVDLLWLGGIGTYVKAGSEKQEDADDRNNDMVRVDAGDIKARVVGEGANLGFTQKARVEFCLSGGRINTDAIDNSAGVDISDHEVNLKILLYELQKKQLIDDYQQLFTGITDEVCLSVLANNYAQSLCISMDQIRCGNSSESFMKLADRLESAGLLDRTVESFPGNKEVLSRQVQSLTRPELAVLMATGKMLLTQLLQEQHDLIIAEYCSPYLQAYFPEQIRIKYRNDISAHPLANVIKATMISNRIINQAGCTFLHLNVEMANTDMIKSVASYLTFDRVLDGNSLRQAIFLLDNKVDTDTQYQMLMQLENTLAVFCRWFLHEDNPIQPEDETIHRYTGFLEEYEHYFQLHGEDENERPYQNQLNDYQQRGVPVDLAQRIIFISRLEDFPRIVKLSIETAENIQTILGLFNETVECLGLVEVYEQLGKIPISDRWEKEVLDNLRGSFKGIVGQLIAELVRSGKKNCAEYLAEPGNKHHFDRYQRVYQEINSSLPIRLLPYIALGKELEKLVED